LSLMECLLTLLIFLLTFHVQLFFSFCFKVTDALVPVVTAQLGKPVTLTCDLSKKFENMDWLQWHKQTTGDTLKLISVLQKNANPIYGAGFSSINFNSTYNNKMFNLTILRTSKEDKGMYHCVHMNRFESIWNGSYLSLEETTSSYRVVQQPAVLDPSRPAESDTLQCSLLSQPGEKTCSGEPSVFWLRTKPDKSVPDLIFTDGKTPENCEKPSNAEKRCSYNFSKKVSPSDLGTYYCAVATCGEILLGDGTRVEIGMISFYHTLSQYLSMMGFLTETITEEGEHLTYAALHFSTGTTNRRELKTKESVYSNVRLSHLENTS
uniref:Ig-like domain-containing protein n=1 Tax=Cyprinodon variegatus TaxID=28743 RepID=A0A3Q2D900_CYPVA